MHVAVRHACTKLRLKSGFERSNQELRATKQALYIVYRICAIQASEPIVDGRVKTVHSVCGTYAK